MMILNSGAHRVVILLCTGLSLYGGIATAEIKDSRKPATCEQSLSLEGFRASALSQSPLVAEIDRDYAKELASAFDTEVLINPELQAEQTFTRMNVGGDDDPQAQVSIGQTIRLSNFGSRERVAALIRRSGDRQKRAQILELTQKLLVQFRTLYVLQETEKILANAEQRAAKKVLLISAGVKKGLLSQGDEKLFDGERYRLQAQRKGVAATIATLQSELARSTGSPCTILTTGQELLTELPSEELLLQKARSSDLSESTRVDLLVNLAREEMRLSELDAYPQITPRLVYQHTNDGGDFFGAGLSMPLPFWNRNQGQQIRSRAEQRFVEAKSTFLSNGGLEVQIKNLRRAAESSKEQSEIFSLKVIPSFEAALRSQEKLYAEGKGNVLQVWQTLRTFNEVQTQGLQLWLEAVSVRVQLSLLVGEEV